MSLESWNGNHWIEKYTTTKAEIEALIDMARKDLTQTELPGLTDDWKLKIAYEAALCCARAALNKCGYRVSRTGDHYREIMSLIFTVEIDKEVVDLLNRFRMKRNQAAYETAGIVSNKEAEEMKGLAYKLLSQTTEWLQKR